MKNNFDNIIYIFLSIALVMGQVLLDGMLL